MKNHIHHPVRIVLLAAAILTLLSFVPTSFNLFGFTTKPITMFSDLAPDVHTDRKKDTVMMAAVKVAPPDFKDVDSLHFKKGCYPIEDFAARQDNLAVFYNALANAKKKKVHIAFFGDSMIEGDIVTQDLRAMLQKKFGGKGVGFVPIMNFVPGFRQSIHQTFSDNWKAYTVIEDRQASIPYGLNGETYIPNITGGGDDDKQKSPASWVAFQGVKPNAGPDDFRIVKLYYTNPDSAAAKVYVKKDDGDATPIKLAKGRGLKVLTLNSAKAIHSIQLTFTTNDKIYIYGADFEDSTGVYVDDLDMRGASGQQLSVLDDGLMHQFQDDLGIKFIVLQYGINVVHSGTDKYSYYTKGFSGTINSLKDKFPASAILINSVSDRAVRKHGAYETMPEIHDFVDVQHDIAKQTNVAFWNLFEAMGADSSMIKMVESDLPLANKDYTHFKPLGGSYIASYMYYSLLYDYEKYEWVQQHKGNERT